MKKITAILLILCMAATCLLSSGMGPIDQLSPVSEVQAASYPALKTINYKATGNQRKDIIGFAKTQTGYAEKGNNNTYFGSWFGLNYNPWCAMFVSWSASKAGVSTSVIPRLSAADRSWAKKQGVYYKSKQWGGSYTPKEGDLIYFSWSVRDWADHIGMVTGTGKKNGTTYVYTIEGNKHDKVTEGTYALNNKYILGYASPKYTTEKAATTYTLKYRDGLDETSNDEEDAIISPVKGTFGKNLALSTTKFTRKGYRYTKWNVYREDNNGYLIYLCRDTATGKKEKWYKKSSIPSTYTQVTVKCGGNLKINDSVTGTVYVSPVWTKAKYTITFDANGGSKAPDSQLKTYQQDLTLTTSKPVRDGYKFLGWATNANAKTSEYAAGAIYSTNKTVTLYAVWKAASYEARTTSVVKGRTGPGTEYNEVVEYAAGEKVMVTEVSTDGKWGKLSDGNWLSLEYTSKLTKTYTLQYSDGLDSTKDDTSIIPTVKNLTYGKEVTISSKQFERKGYHYSKWLIYRKADGKTLYLCRDKKTGTIESWYQKDKVPQKQELVYVKPGKSLTIQNAVGDKIYLRPSWVRNEYTIKYKANGGKNAPKSQTKQYGKDLKLRTDQPSRSGYTFQGWAGSADAKKIKYKKGASYTANKSITLYAVWKAKEKQTAAAKVKVLYKAKTTADVNKRKGPGTQYKIIKTLPKGRSISIVKEKNGWVKLYHGGWVHGAYIKKVKETKATVKTTTKKASSSASQVFTIKMTATDVNLRSGPGTDYASKGVAREGATYQIKKVSNGWGQIKGSGYWILLKYAKITAGYKVKVTAKDLAMRTGPGTKYDSDGYIKPGTYTISKINGKWGKVKSEGKWIHLSYTKRVN